MDPSLYRLHEIHKIERGLSEKNVKHSTMISRYHCLLNFFTFGCLLIFQFCMFLLNIGFLSNFEEIIGTISGKVLHGLNVFFGSASNFRKYLKNSFSTKYRDMRSKKLWLSCGSTQFVTWFRRCWLTTKFLKSSLRKFFLKQQNENLMKCSQKKNV